MKPLRLIGNAIILTVYLVRVTAFVVTRVCGSWIGGAALIGLSILLLTHANEAPALAYIPMAFAAACRVAHPRLRVRSRPRLLRGPAPPPPPPPSASTAKGRSDDPTEATVIGRLDPKLRDLLRPKSDGAAG